VIEQIQRASPVTQTPINNRDNLAATSKSQYQQQQQPHMNYATQPQQPNQSNNTNTTYLEFQTSPELLSIPTPPSQETPIIKSQEKIQYQQQMQQQMNTTGNVFNGLTSGLLNQMAGTACLEQLIPIVNSLQKELTALCEFDQIAVVGVKVLVNQLF